MALAPEESTFLFETPDAYPREILIAVARIFFQNLIGSEADR